ncbi:hypothetical protein L218DRAFT_423535 [Marasmius fiardii PR-910]|nr:hypothetical protein L218DRAFT_423535 [Marasmius fiardii PR-910]
MVYDERKIGSNELISRARAINAEAEGDGVEGEHVAEEKKRKEKIPAWITDLKNHPHEHDLHSHAPSQIFYRCPHRNTPPAHTSSRLPFAVGATSLLTRTQKGESRGYYSEVGDPSSSGVGMEWREGDQTILRIGMEETRVIGGHDCDCRSGMSAWMIVWGAKKIYMEDLNESTISNCGSSASIH